MQIHEDDFLAADGLKLHETLWSIESSPKAIVVLVHGITDHGGRHADFAARLNQQGYAVCAIDLRGHGKSQGARIWVESFDQYLADLDLLTRRVLERYTDRPVFLLGHSMGGAIVALFAERYRPAVAGIILVAPALGVSDRVFPLLRRLAPLASRLLPRLRIVRLGGSGLSRNPEVVEQFRVDPLVFHGRIPVRTGNEVLQIGRRIAEAAGDFHLPLLILHGTADSVTDPAASQRFVEQAASADKKLILYEGLYHDLFREPEKDQVYGDLLAWLDARSNPHTA